MADLLILANSMKNGGYCVAGKDIHTNQWIRIVGDPKGSKLDLDQTAYKNRDGIVQNTPYEPFNKLVRIDLGNPVPLNYQPENILIGQTPWQEIQADYPHILYDTPTDLWGMGDRINTVDIQQGLVIAQSLYLIQVRNLCFHFIYHGDFRKNRVSFHYGDICYELAATMDPSIFEALVNGQRTYTNVLTVSLGGPFFNSYTNQYEHYKLVAAAF